MRDFTPDNDEIIAVRVVLPYHLYLLKNGIIFIRISNEKPETVELAKEMVEQMGEMINYQKVPMLAWHEIGALPEKENRDYWAKKESCPYSIADAFIVPFLSMRLLAGFYSKVNKPERPTRFFTDPEEAMAWLETFVKNEASAEVNKSEVYG